MKLPRRWRKLARTFREQRVIPKKYLSQAPEGEPGDAEARRLLGVLFEKQGRKTEARLEFQTAHQIRAQFQSGEEGPEESNGLKAPAPHRAFLAEPYGSEKAPSRRRQ